jgi:hypothetical protein
LTVRLAARTCPLWRQLRHHLPQFQIMDANTLYPISGHTDRKRSASR